MKKRAQLVCQHLENISREALERNPEIIYQYVRGRQGVYALYRHGKLYYVGLATNLRNRLKHHLKDRHGHSWDRFSVYLTIGDHHLRELEALILRTVKPKGNKQKGKFARSEDLRRRFRRDSKRNALAQVDGLFVEMHPARTRRETVDEPDGRKPILAVYITGPMKLRSFYKGKKLNARVRKNGTIRYAGKIYTSPSVAGAAAVKRRTCNGWTFWEYERAPGDWVKLDTLRI
ncbi:MAG: hypothetical protein PHW60_08110 [Kiritimatiellae bacterium]|nr:hypothetical protein [Kiritimatiellia bacterium]